MDKILRCITSNGGVMASAIDSTNLVYTAQRVHKTSPVVSAALGRLLTASSMMGAALKQKEATITLRVAGGGPVGSLVAVADSRGNCRGYAANPSVELERKANGKLDVGAAVGREGLLYVMRDYGTGEPYIGQTPLVTGEIAEDITSYYAHSEQIPTVCALGVLVDREDASVLLAGGLLLQLLPGASEEEIAMLERNVAALEPVTTMLAKGMSIEEMCRKALSGFEVEVLDEMEVGYVCNCSRDRVVRAVSLLSREELISMAEEPQGFAEAQCHFCDKTYRISSEELYQMAAAKK